MAMQEYLELGRLLIDFPLSYQAIKEINIRETGNEHGRLKLTLVAAGQLSRDDILRYEDAPIQIFTPDGEGIYAGICTEIGISCMNQYTEIMLGAGSFSVLADRKPMTRTFQDPSKCLSQIVETVLGPYGYSVSLQKDVAIPFMLSQQEETDWAFIRRIANQLGFMVFADSRSPMKRISIGAVPFSSLNLPPQSELKSLGKDISAFWQVKNSLAPGASAYEFLQEGYQTADLSFGVGYGITGGLSGQIVTGSSITASGGLLVHSFIASYQDGAYPGIEGDGENPKQNSGNKSSASRVAAATGTVNSSSIISGKVLAVSGTNIQVEFSDGTAGGVRWFPYSDFLGNDFYSMPDVGDTVYCYYENNGALICLGSKHVSTDSPDFGKPEEKVLTANNRMIRLKADGIDITGCRSEMDGQGGSRVRILFSDKDGIEISAEKEVNIRADRAVLIQSNALETVQDEPTKWFDEEREGRMQTFESEQEKGHATYVADGGNDNYNAGWEVVKTVGGNLFNGLKDEILSPFQLISTIGSLGSSEGEAADSQDDPAVTFEKVYEHQVMILGLDRCTLQVPGSSVRFYENTIVVGSPKLWWFGFNRSSEYPEVSESQKTMMDTMMDTVQLAIDVVGLLPCCNVICGALNAGISLLRGDYYGAVSGVMGMLMPGGGLIFRAIDMVADTSKTAKKVVTALRMLKAGAIAANAALLGGSDAIELVNRIWTGEFSVTDQDDLELINSLGQNTMIATQSAKDIYDNVRKARTPQGDTSPSKDSADEAGVIKKESDGQQPKSSEQKSENEKTCADPIDVITGSQKIVQIDFVIKDLTEPFRLMRIYQSVYENPGGLLGSRWFINIGSWLTVDGDKAVVILPDMHLERFRKTDCGWENERGKDQSVILEEGQDEYCLFLSAEKKRYIYNRSGKLERILDRNGNSTWMRYMGAALQEIHFAGGQRLSFRYQDGKICEIKDILGRTIRYRYEKELLTEAEYPNQGIIRYRYTPEGYLREITDQNGNTYVHNEYDMDGRVARQLLSNGQEYVILYDDSNRVNTFLTPESGQRLEYHYNKDKLLTKTVYADGTFEEQGYDEFQNCNYHRDRKGNELRRSFDSHGNLLKEERPGGLITEYTYDDEGNLLREWDNGGRCREMSYDSRGNRILCRTLIEANLWQETRYKYDRCGRLRSIEDANGNTLEMTYQGNQPGMSSLITPEGYTSYYTYDASGCCMSMTDDMGETEYTYNQMDYRVYVKDPLGNTTKYCFDRLCNLVKLIRPNQFDEKTGDGAGTQYLYDAMDEEIRRIDPLGNVFALSRDLEGNVIKEIHPNSYDAKSDDGLGVQYEYDPDGRRIRIIYPDGGTERIYYDANGNIIKKIQPEQYDKETDSGVGYCYEYDSENRLVQITDPEGTVTRRYVYDLYGNIIKEIDALGFLSADKDEQRIGVRYRYNAAGWLTEKREPVIWENGRVKYRLTAYRHDLAGNMTQEVRYLEFQAEEGAEGPIHTLTFAYDKDNRRIRVSDSTGAEATYTYNCRNQCVSETRKLRENLLQTIRYEYDAAGRQIRRSASAGRINGLQQFASTLYDYDRNGNCVRVRLPEGGEIRREYDAADRLIAETHVHKKSGICNRTVFAYDKAGNLTEVTDNLGRKTQIEYDLLNQEIRRTERDGSITRRFYNLDGLLKKLVRPNQYDAGEDNGTGFQYTYDLQGRVRTIVGPDGHVLQTNTYDERGNLIRQEDAVNSRVTFSYNLAGSRTSIRSTGSASQELEYDARGNIIGVLDGNRNRTEYVVDEWGRITEIVRPDGVAEAYTYDFAGNLCSSTDAEGHETSYEYDCAGNVTAITDALGNTEQYIYDKEGRLAEKTDRNGTITEYAFNLYGAPLYRREKGSLQGDFYEYTPEGLLKSAISGNMAYRYDYDAMDRLIRRSASGRTLLALSYDGNGNRISQTDVTGNVTEYRLDSLDRLTEVWDGGKKLVGYIYNPDGSLRQESHGPLTKEYAYDGDKNLTGLRILCGNDLLADNRYHYDGNGNLLEKRQLSGITTYAYDTLNQLVRAEYPSYGEELFYDRSGNRTRRLTAGMEERYHYDAGNRLTRLTRNGEDILFHYDNAGNMLSDGKASYSYDAFNRMTRAEAFDGNIQINRYDAEGLRAEMEENGRLVQFIYNTSREVSTETEGNDISRYIRVSELIARSTDTESARTYYHYVSDELGSITHVTDEAGKVLNRYEYDAWGNLSLKEEQISNRFFYAGEQLDAVTQQYYLRARFYNPALGRFLQEDTYRADGLNLYAYCANNPVYYADPSGHWCTEKQNVYEKLVKAQGLDPNTIDPDTKLRLMAEAANIVKGKNGANIAANNGALEMPGPILGEQNRLPGPVAESVEAQGRNKSGTPSHSLLPGEGEIGTYKDLLDAGEVGDNITPHHMPSAEYMSQYGVDKKDGLCMNMEMPSPGTGGRHRLTDTYGRNMTDAEKAYYYSLSPRDALAYDIANMRRIYQSQGLYSEIRPKLQEYIKQYKALMPELFDK